MIFCRSNHIFSLSIFYNALILPLPSLFFSHFLLSVYLSHSFFLPPPLFFSLSVSLSLGAEEPVYLPAPDNPEEAQGVCDTGQEEEEKISHWGSHSSGGESWKCEDKHGYVRCIRKIGSQNLNRVCRHPDRYHVCLLFYQACCLH